MNDHSAVDGLELICVGVIAVIALQFAVDYVRKAFHLIASQWHAGYISNRASDWRYVFAIFFRALQGVKAAAATRSSRDYHKTFSVSHRPSWRPMRLSAMERKYYA